MFIQPQEPIDETHLSEEDKKALEDVRRRLFKVVAISGLVMLGGFILVFSVIAYRFFNYEPITEFAAGLSVPAASNVVSASLDGDRILLTVEQDGRKSLIVYDTETGKQLARIPLNPALPEQ